MHRYRRIGIVERRNIRLRKEQDLPEFRQLHVRDSIIFKELVLILYHHTTLYKHTGQTIWIWVLWLYFSKQVELCCIVFMIPSKSLSKLRIGQKGTLAYSSTNARVLGSSRRALSDGSINKPSFSPSKRILQIHHSPVRICSGAHRIREFSGSPRNLQQEQETPVIATEDAHLKYELSNIRGFGVHAPSKPERSLWHLPCETLESTRLAIQWTNKKKVTTEACYSILLRTKVWAPDKATRSCSFRPICFTKTHRRWSIPAIKYNHEQTWAQFDKSTNRKRNHHTVL